MYNIGLPTIVCPFFGDQPFWGGRVHSAGAGPKPIRINTCTVEELASTFEYACQEHVAEAAREISRNMSTEKGPFNTMCAIHSNINTDDMKCDLFNKHIAKVYLYFLYLICSSLRVDIAPG